MQICVREGEPPRQLHFDLKEPCPECPFRKNAPPHEGIFAALPNYARELEAKQLIHSCHRTDPRSDYLQGKDFKGKLQHCAGALALQVNEGTAMENVTLLHATVSSRKPFFPDELPKNPEVFGSFREMVLYYAKHFKHLLRDWA